MATAAVEGMRTKKPLKLFRILESLPRKQLQIELIARLLLDQISPSLGIIISLNLNCI